MVAESFTFRSFTGLRGMPMPSACIGKSRTGLNLSPPVAQDMHLNIFSDCVIKKVGKAGKVRGGGGSVLGAASMLFAAVNYVPSWSDGPCHMTEPCIDKVFFLCNAAGATELHVEHPQKGID